LQIPDPSVYFIKFAIKTQDVYISRTYNIDPDYSFNGQNLS